MAPLSERPPFADHRSNIREWFCDHVPRPNTRPANIQFFEWFRRDCKFLLAHSQIVWQRDRLATHVLTSLEHAEANPAPQQKQEAIHRGQWPQETPSGSNEGTRCTKGSHATRRGRSRPRAPKAVF